MKLYENVVIGNFLYGLGLAVARRVRETKFPSVINLLQQTPDDEALGDLVMSFPGVMRILEFKQQSNTSHKEPHRHARLKVALGDSEARIRTSREVHWFIETAPTETSFVSRIVPYLDAYPADQSRHDFASFVEATADAAVGGESRSSHDAMKDYLLFLAACHKSGKIGSGGLVVKISPDGSLGYVALESLRDMLLTRGKVISRILEQEKALELERPIEHKLEREQGREFR